MSLSILGFSARAMHGKDTCAKIAGEIMRDEFGVNMGVWALAHTLKAATFGESNGLFSFEDVWYNKPPEIRERLQKRGTEEGRNKYGENVWILQTEAYLRLFEQAMPFMGAVAIPDVRFPNEVDFVRLGGKVPDMVLNEIRRKASEDLGFTEEVEAEMLNTDPAALLDLESTWQELVISDYALELSASKGMSLYITSDRPTLTGKAAQHLSETALDCLDKERSFDGVIVNNLDTTLEDLRVQLRPYVQALLER
jgi:hypothetical protein